jgi:hypothetical protein
MTLAVTLLLAGVLISAPAVHAQTGSDAPAQTFTGTLYSSAGGSAISGSPVSGNVYYTQSGTPVLYLDGWYYYPFTVQEDGAEVAGIDDEPTTNGWYSIRLRANECITIMDGITIRSSVQILLPRECPPAGLPDLARLL